MNAVAIMKLLCLVWIAYLSKMDAIHKLLLRERSKMMSSFQAYELAIVLALPWLQVFSALDSNSF